MTTWKTLKFIIPLVFFYCAEDHGLMERVGCALPTAIGITRILFSTTSVSAVCGRAETS